MSLQKRTVVLEPGSWPQRCGKEDSPWKHRGKEIKASVLPTQVNVVTHGKSLIHRKCFLKACKTVYRTSIPEKLGYSQSPKKLLSVRKHWWNLINMSHGLLKHFQTKIFIYYPPCIRKWFYLLTGKKGLKHHSKSKGREGVLS